MPAALEKTRRHTGRQLESDRAQRSVSKRSGFGTVGADAPVALDFISAVFSLAIGIYATSLNSRCSWRAQTQAAPANASTIRMRIRA